MSQEFNFIEQYIRMYDCKSFTNFIPFDFWLWIFISLAKLKSSILVCKFNLFDYIQS